MTRRNVAIVLWHDAELLDFAGPGEVFAAAGDFRAFTVYTVAETRDPVLSQGFLTVVPQYTIDDCPAPDIVVLPGGGTEQAARSPRMMAWIERVSGSAEITLSVCTGAMLLARAGLLDGLAATTWHGAIERLRRAAPRTRVHDDRRFVDNGRIVTSAGVSAGIDAALHLVARLHGHAVARETARYMEYEWTGPRSV